MSAIIPAMNDIDNVEIAINDQIKSAAVPPLTFHEVNSNGEIIRDANKEAVRRLIWNLWNDRKLSVKEISNEVKMQQYVVRAQLAICQTRFDEWIQTHGLLVYGTDKARLLAHIGKLEGVLLEIEEDIREAEGDKGKAAYRKLQLQVLNELAKYKGIVPVQELNITITSAQETRSTMKRLFPDSTEAQFRVINDTPRDDDE